MSTTILALDLGTITGFALAGTLPLTPSSVVSGSMDFRPRRFEGGGMRFLRFKRWVAELKGDGELGAVHFEEVRRHAGADAAHVYGGFLGVLTGWCEARLIPYAGVPVGTIKRFATGKGNADKKRRLWRRCVVAASRRSMTTRRTRSRCFCGRLTPPRNDGRVTIRSVRR